jgi:HEAT repeat protein
MPATGTISGFALVVLNGEPEPVHEERWFSSWLWDLHLANRFTADGEGGAKFEPTEKYTRAAEAMRKMGPKSFPPLLAILRAHDPSVKLSLGNKEERQGRLLKTYTDCAMEAFEALGSLATPLVPELGRRLHNSVVVEALVHIGPAAHEELIKALAHPQPEIRALAAKGFGDERNHNPQALPALRQCLSDPVPEVQYRAAIALARMKDEPAALVPMLTECVRSHTNERTREFVVFALRDIGEAARVAVPVLLEAYANGSGMMKATVALSLHSIDAVAAKAANFDVKDLEK